MNYKEYRKEKLNEKRAKWADRVLKKNRRAAIKIAKWEEKQESKKTHYKYKKAACM